MVTFTEPTTEMSIANDVVVGHYEAEPLDFIVDEKALMFPFYFDPSERVDLIPYQRCASPATASKLVSGWSSSGVPAR